jgi:hypothetical protein
MADLQHLRTSPKPWLQDPDYVGWRAVPLGFEDKIKLYFHQTKDFKVPEAFTWNTVLESLYGPAWTSQMIRIIPKGFKKSNQIIEVEEMMRDNNPARFPRLPTKPKAQARVQTAISEQTNHKLERAAQPQTKVETQVRDETQEPVEKKSKH